jgi:branched-chain amino acid transport system ATP-binding protein
MNAPKPPLLEIQALSCRFGGLVAVDGVSLAVREGEIFGLLGPNGAGKTTLFNLISGITRPSGGSVFWKGGEITGAPSHRVAALGMARTFQNLRLFASLSCLDNVRVGLHRHSRQPKLQALLGTAAFRRRERALRQEALDLLASVGIAEAAERPSGDLSYGQRRRLEIARALACRPELLLLDEPAAGMNPSEKQELAGLIRQIRQRHQLTVLIIEHHVPLMMELCDRLAVLNFGRRIALGSPQLVRQDPAVIEAYLGAAATAHVSGTAAGGAANSGTPGLRAPVLRAEGSRTEGPRAAGSPGDEASPGGSR